MMIIHLIRFKEKGNIVVSMNVKEIEALQNYLQRTLKSDCVKVVAPKKKGQPVELCVQDGKGLESIGTVYKDEDEGEVSYAISLIVLEEDLQ